MTETPAAQLARLLHEKYSELVPSPVTSRFWDDIPAIKRRKLAEICEAALDEIDWETPTPPKPNPNRTKWPT